MSSKNIYQRINAVMKVVEYVKKDSVVQNYRAVTHDMVTAVIRKHLVEHGIVVHLEQLGSSIIDKGTTKSGATTYLYSADYGVSFVNIDNPEDRLTVTINAHAADTGDKAPGKAASYATKYAMLKVFSLETGENEESRTAEYSGHTQVQKSEFDELMEKKDALGMYVFSQTVGPDVMASLHNSFEKGKISAGKKLCNELLTEGSDRLDDIAVEIQALIQAEDPAVAQNVDELTDMEKRLVAKRLSQAEIEYLRNIK